MHTNQYMKGEIYIERIGNTQNWFSYVTVL